MISKDFQPLSILTHLYVRYMKALIMRFCYFLLLDIAMRHMKVIHPLSINIDIFYTPQAQSHSHLI